MCNDKILKCQDNFSKTRIPAKANSFSNSFKKLKLCGGAIMKLR